MSHHSGRSDSGPKAKLVWIGRGCNNNCSTCPFPDERFNQELDEIQNRRKNEVQLVFVGREPAIHPDFIDYVKAANLSGYNIIEVVTNGRIFSSPRFAKRAVHAGLTDVLIKLSSSNSKIHDSITGVDGSWNQTINGMRNLLKLSKSGHPFLRPSVVVGIYLCEKNIKTLDNTIEFLKSEGVKEIFIINAGVDKSALGNITDKCIMTLGFDSDRDYKEFAKKNKVISHSETP